jgi:NAD(P)-dependent dehydrogenase (short-subunit alcohol dehydrogenase family)
MDLSCGPPLKPGDSAEPLTRLCAIGGTSGIGRRTVEVFAHEGASILIAARREREGRNLADALGNKVDFLQTDVSLETDIKRMIDYTLERFGKLNCLFNNEASPAPRGGITTINMAEYEAALAVLLGGVVLGMKHAAPVMRAQGSGSIINTGSVAGVLAGYGSSLIYSAAKAAVIHLTTLVAMELGESNIRVNCISPGGIATGALGKIAGLPVEEAEKTADTVKQFLAKAQPSVGRASRTILRWWPCSWRRTTPPLSTAII